MTFEILFILVLVAVTVALFMSERLPVDLVALLILAVLLVSSLFDVLDPSVAVAGFSNPATVTVAAMFVLSAGLTRTGAVSIVGRWLAAAFERGFWFGTAAMMLLVGIASGFINNTAAVAILLPVMLDIARSTGIPPSKLLIPLSFASMFGGVMTLLGSSTNILVSAIVEENGYRPFGMFELTPLGIVFLGVGLVYMMTLGIRQLPERGMESNLVQEFKMRDYLTEIVLLEGSPAAGRPLMDSPLVRELDLDVLAVRRDGEEIPLPGPHFRPVAGDVLRVRCNLKKIRRLQQEDGYELHPEVQFRDQDLETGETVLVEAILSPTSKLADRTLVKSRFRATYGATVLAIRHHGQVFHEGLATTRLRPGDALLLQMRREQLPRLLKDPDFVLISELAVPQVRRGKMTTALAILVGVVAVAAVGILPIVASSVVGAVLMALTGCLTLEQAYEAIEWKVIFLLAGVLALGAALESTGAAGFLAVGVVTLAGPWGVIALVSAFYLLTSLLTETLSNNATAALLAPLAIATAEGMGLDPRPFLMAVTFAASASFMTPVGYQTNTLIMAPGRYRFRDFFAVGAPLNLIFWILGTLLIPVIWPAG